MDENEDFLNLSIDCISEAVAISNVYRSEKYCHRDRYRICVGCQISSLVPICRHFLRTKHKAQCVMSLNWTIDICIIYVPTYIFISIVYSNRINQNIFVIRMSKTGKVDKYYMKNTNLTLYDIQYTHNVTQLHHKFPIHIK